MEVILITKPGKVPNNLTSYQAISLIHVILKILEILQRRINSDPNTEQWKPDHRIGFRVTHATVQQTHRRNQVVKIILHISKGVNCAGHYSHRD